MPDPLVTRHHEILDAAVADMLAHGVPALKVDRVAEAAGVAKGTVYLYFPTRDELVRAALDRGLIMDELTDGWPDAITPDSLPRLMDSLWGALEERDEVVRLVVRHGYAPLGPAARAALIGAERSLARRLPVAAHARSLLASVVGAYVADPDRSQIPALTALWSRALGL